MYTLLHIEYVRFLSRVVFLPLSALTDLTAEFARLKHLAVTHIPAVVSFPPTNTFKSASLLTGVLHIFFFLF